MRSSISVIVTGDSYPSRDESLYDIGIAASSFAQLKKKQTRREAALNAKETRRQVEQRQTKGRSRMKGK